MVTVVFGGTPGSCPCDSGNHGGDHGVLTGWSLGKRFVLK